MHDFLATLAFSFGVTGPIFILLGLGIVLRRVGLLNDALIEGGSRLVFTVALPVMLFLSVSQTRIGAGGSLAMIGYGLAATLLIFMLAEALAVRIEPARDRGVVVQGVFRSNMGIIGLAYCMNAYGSAGVATVSLYLGVVTIFYNVLAVITLSRSLSQNRGVGPVLRGIVRNPLIIGIVLALPVSYFELKIPVVLLKAGESLTGMTLPLALLCTGATLNFGSLRREPGSTLFATVGKLVMAPLLYTAGALALGFRGIELGVMVLMVSAPTAAASYVMVRAMQGNAALAANIIALTTAGSLITTSALLTVLRAAGVV